MRRLAEGDWKPRDQPVSLLRVALEEIQPAKMSGAKRRLSRSMASLQEPWPAGISGTCSTSSSGIQPWPRRTSPKFEVHLCSDRCQTKIKNEAKEHAIGSLSRSFSCSDFRVLRNGSVDVTPGEVFGIVGRIGGVKKTFHKVLSRVFRPPSGHVFDRGPVAPPVSPRYGGSS